MGSKHYVLRIFVRMPYLVEEPGYWRHVMKAMGRVGLSVYPDDVELGGNTVVLVYRDGKALEVLKQVKHHYMCRRRIIAWSAGIYTCFDASGNPFWILNVFGARKRVVRGRR